MSSKAMTGFGLMVAAVIIGGLILAAIQSWRAKQQEVA